MKIMIVGATGELGSKIVEHFIETDFEIKDLVIGARSPEKAGNFADKGIEIRHADYDNYESMAKAFKGIDRLLLIPSIVAPAQRVQQYDNAINAAGEAGVNHLLHCSLVPISVEAPFLITPFLVYAESAIRTSGISWTILRNDLYIDPIIEWVDSIIEMGTIPYPTGDGKCAYVSRDDLARATAAVLTSEGHKNKVYNLTGPELLTTADLCDIVAEVTGKKVEDSDATDQDYIDICVKEGEPEQLTQFLLTLYHTIKEGFLDVVSTDIKDLTGKKPLSFKEMLVNRYK